jgi:oxygen-independent coproporphyrinogen-3 oxidase
MRDANLPEIDFSSHFAQPGPQPFAERHATMPWSGSMPVPREQTDATWQRLRVQALPPRSRLLYLHVPFCSTHCAFCGFYQNRYEATACEKYTEDLLREIELDADSPLMQSTPVEAIYFGGGTPTALSAADLARLLTMLRTRLPLAPDCEITIEGRILGFDDERISACIDAGANRFSIGIQSFQTEIRRQMGRTSDGLRAVRFIEDLCRRDRATVVCDLLFGLPGQNAENWMRDLRQAREIGLDGIDLYALNLFPTTALGQAVASGNTAIPSYLECRDLYRTGCDFFREAGWRQISNSHWARTARERNRYNTAIKQGADCVAFGTGGGGSLNGYAWMNLRALDAYHQAIHAGRKPLMMMLRAMEPDFAWRQHLQGGIEAGHVRLDEITSEVTHLLPLLTQWHEAGLLEEAAAEFHLTDEGRFWASNLLNSLQVVLSEMKTPAHTAMKMPHPAVEGMKKGHGSLVHFG